MTQARACQVVFELVQNDDVDALISQLEQQPFLINIADETAQTLLIRAAERGSVKVLKELLKRNTLGPNETDQDETTALIAAAKENNQECVTELINSGADLTITDKDDWGAITWAAYRGHVDVVKILLAVEANPNETGQHGMNPVIWAAGRGHTNVVEELLNAGGNPDSCDKYGTSALVWASRKGHGDIIKVLLDKGANVDKPGTSGWTPLIMAAKGGFEQAAGVLLNNGADVNFLDQNKYSALIWAVKQGHTNIVRTLSDHGSFINIRNKEGIPVLTLAAKEGHVEIVRILLEHYADVEAMDLVGKTALWYAVEKGHADIVKELLEFGAFTECKRKDGETPLLLAVRKKHTEITSLLLNKNADLSVSNKQGDTALHIAVRCRYRRIAEIILKDPKSARLLYQTNRAGETPYRIDHRHKKSILKPVLGMAEGDWRHTEELLGHDVYTTSLAELLCEPSLEVPLTVGVYARWGSSKVHFFKSLQQEMKEITQQTVRPKLRFTVFGVLTCLFFCTLLGVCFCSAFNWIVGIAVGGTVLVLSHVIYLVILLWENKWCDNTEPSWISEYFCRFSSYFYLLYLITFCVPPTLTSMRSSLPVHFAFADFSKLTRSSNEATALVSMIETLTEVIESNFGCAATRLFRVLRPPLLDYVGIKHSQPQFKKCCCCLPKLCIFFFVVTCGAVALVLCTTVGSDGSSVVAGLQISGACIVGIALVVHSTTFCSVIYSLLFSPKRRVSIVATQLGLKEEGFIHALKQEVELLTEVAVAMDGFENIQTRIILFLDGLDHSEQQKVLHLVDSINLLFTDPDAPFISIIAIDPRVTVRAIEQNFSNVLQDSHITALDYLKSIIHLPFFLPEPKTSCSGNLPDSLRLSVEQLLRQRKTSGFELEWEGESFELSPGSVDKWKANGAVANNKHTTVLTVDQSQTVEGKFSARLNRSYMDIHFDQHEDSPDLTHVLADNETLTPLGIQRLLHTTSLSGRLLRAKGFDFRWNGLASWVSLVDAWPYRVSWLVHIMEEFTNILPDNLPLKALYMSTQTWLPNSNGLDYAVDNDPAYFESFLGNHCPILKMEDLRKFLVGTINLDPTIRNQISQGLQACSSKTLSKTESAGIGAGGLGQSDSLDLGSLSEEDVCVKLSQIDGIQLTSMPSYQMTIRENHINGRVLCECEISELHDVMEMNFGDWQLFRAWILRHRPSEVCQESGCSAWVDDQVERAKADSADTYVEMGNLSCVKSNASTSQDRTGGENRSPQSGNKRGPTNKPTIPTIVLDPGSSFNSISNCDQVQTAGDGENVSDAGQDADNIRHDGEKKVQVMMSNDVYSITPRLNITDSSEDEGSATENTPLMNDEVSSASKDREETPKGHSDEIRPLLSRQDEIDEGANSKQETDVDNTSPNVEAGCMSNNSTCTGLNIIEDDNVESQRVTPILFTLSPTKKGNNQVVSSVVATRDVSLALSRSPSLPGSPSSRRPKSPKSPRSPKSSRSLRGIFSCRSPLPSEDNADEDNDKGQPAVTEDISGFDPRAPNGHCLIQDTHEVKQSDKKVTDVETSSVHVDLESHAGEEDVDVIHAQTPTWLELAPTKDSNVSSNEISQDPSKDSVSSETLQPFVESSTGRPASLDNPNVNRCSKDNLFEETTTNSDKGYESVDNSPSCVENDDGVYPSLNANGSVSTNGLSETTNPVWVPCMESKTFPRRHKPTAISGRGSHFLHQTMV